MSSDDRNKVRKLLAYGAVIVVAGADLWWTDLFDEPALAFLDTFLASTVATLVVGLLEAEHLL